MNWKSLFFVLWPCRRRYFAAILAGALLPLAVSAQEAETEAEEMPEDEEELLELSPFVVDEREDTGYWTNNTLVGTRIRSNLDDLAASITVINEQFMEDTSSVDIRDALVYVANAESPSNHYNPGHDAGTMAGGGYPATQNNSRYEGRKNRLRGLRPATITRDLFISDITPDGYNMERAEVNRGPNSVLFGLGSPAGVINYTTKKARYQDSTDLTVRLGSFNQRRAVLDINRLIMDNEQWGQFAFRVIGLTEHRERNFEKYFEDDERFYVTGAWSPRPNTTFRANGEVTRGRAARVRPMPPLDGYTGWVSAGRPGWNPLEHMGEHTSLPDWFLLDAGHFNYEANGTFIGAMQSRQGPLNRPTHLIPSVTSKGLWQGGAQGSALSFDFFGAQAITDPAIFDFFNNNFMPPHPGTYHNDDLVTWGLGFEQVFFKDKSAGVKVSYGVENYHNWSRDPLWQSQTKILVDPNTHLPTGEVNPHFGRPYIEGYTLMHDEEKDRDTLRVEAYLDLNLEEKVHGWLGRHKLSFLYNDRTDERQLLSGNEGIRGQSLPNELFGEIGRQPNNALWRRWYLADSIDDLPLARPTDYDMFLTGDKPVLWWDTDATPVDPTTGEEGPWCRTNTFGEEVCITEGAFVEGQFHLEEQWTGGNITRNQVESTAAVIQSFWLKKGDGDDHFVVTTLGFRKDDFVGFGRNIIRDSAGFPELDRRVWTFPDTPTAEVGGDTFTFGIVGHVLPWASVHYSDSENFEASGVRTSGTGVTLGVPTGTTEEYGFSLKLLKGKLYAKVNWYETNQINASDSGGLFRWRIPGVENRFFRELRLIDRLDLWTDPNFSYGLNRDDGEMSASSGDIPGLTDVANSTTTGMEIEVVVNPYPNWRVMFNVGQSKAFLKNRQFYTQQYVEERTPAWSRFWDMPSSGQFCSLNWGSTLRDCYNGLLGNVLAGNLLFEGRPTQQLREWRWNFVTTYDFQEGFLKDVSVGGAGRWEEGAKIGNPVIYTADGTPTSDLDNPYIGPERFSFDLWVGYRRIIFDDRVNWKIQLNVRNAFSDDRSTYPTHAQPDGSYQLIAINEPQEFFITNTFSF